MTSTLLHRSGLNESARLRLESTDGGAFLRCDFQDAMFIHFAVEPAVLQPLTPYALQTFQGMAYVSLCLFTLGNLQMQRGDAWAPWNHAPLGDQPLLQVRAAVEHRGESGFFLLDQFLPMATQGGLSERTFGLPCHFAWFNLQADSAARRQARVVAMPTTARSALSYRAVALDPLAVSPEPESLDAFLLERYTVFTEQHRVHRLFRLWHEPPQVQPVELSIEDPSLLASIAPWHGQATCTGAHLCTGLRDVLISRPQWIPAPGSCWT